MIAICVVLYFNKIQIITYTNIKYYDKIKHFVFICLHPQNTNQKLKNRIIQILSPKNTNRIIV